MTRSRLRTDRLEFLPSDQPQRVITTGGRDTHTHTHHASCSRQELNYKTLRLKYEFIVVASMIILIILSLITILTVSRIYNRPKSFAWYDLKKKTITSSSSESRWIYSKINHFSTRILRFIRSRHFGSLSVNDNNIILFTHIRVIRDR